MDFTQILSWVMVIVGFLGFRFVGLKKWWAWYINLACQILWATYAFVTGQPAFLASAAAYFVIFAWNAYKWTKDHLAVKKVLKAMAEEKNGTYLMPGGVEVTFEYGVESAVLHNYDVSSKYPPEYFEYKLDPEDDGMIIHNAKLDGTPAYTLPGDDSNLVKHARAELERTGEDPEVIDWYLRIIREYASFGHSGGSASATAVVLEELLRFRPLGPLTNDPEEWIRHSPDMWDGENHIWQNVRDGRAFSTDGGETYTLVDDPKGPDGKQEIYESACNLCQKRDPMTANLDGKCLGCGISRNDYAGL